ncbi:MAG: NAD-dependent epimerase/dehydratase family protein [Planctomycetota bacterium]
MPGGLPDNLDLVTGGCGFIGRHLVAALREAGRRVRVLDVSPPPAGFEGVELVEGSVTDPSVCRDAVEGADRVFHIAGTAQLWAPDPGVFERVNAGGTSVVFEAARAAGVRTFVHTSSDVVELAAGRDFGPYVRSKVEGERIVSEDAGPMRVVIVRPAAPIGPGDDNMTPPSKLLRMLLTEPPPAYLDCVLDLVDVRDLAAGFIAAAGGDRAIVPLRGHRVRFGELLEAMRAHTGRKLPKARIPYALAYVAAVVGETVSRITKREPSATIAGVKLARALETVPHERGPVEPRPFDMTLADAVAWLRESGRV